MATREKNKEKSTENKKVSSDSPAKDPEFLRFKEMYFELKQKYGKSFDKFFKMDEEYLIPCSIFNKELSSFESAVKYLAENCGLRISAISSMLNRTNKTIWQAYKSASEKMPKKFSDISSKFWIPATIFSDRRLSILEHITTYLKSNYPLSFKQIAKIISRDITTARTVYYRAIHKRGKK